LEKHYRCTDQPSPEKAGYGRAGEELDFIINHDIKYRMGRDGGEEPDE